MQGGNHAPRRLRDGRGPARLCMDTTVYRGKHQRQRKSCAPRSSSPAAGGADFRVGRLVTYLCITREALDHAGFKMFATPELYVA